MCLGLEVRSAEDEPMYFNENGNLSFETQGGAAVSVGYLTIGWIVKKYDLPKEDEDNVTVTCVLHNEAYTDEHNVVHAFFYVSREEMLEKIRAVDADWEAELRTVGGIVYLDAVMTCTWYHEPLGQLFDDGSTQGEVYWTYEGIAGARGWGAPEELHQYYDRKVVFEPEEPVCVVPEEEICTEEIRVTHGWGSMGPNPPGKAWVSSDLYQVEQAVPSGEIVECEGIFSPWAYALTYIRTTVKKYYPVKVNVITRLKWMDKKGIFHEEECVYAQWYMVERKAQIYRVKELSLYWADQFYISTKATDAISRQLSYSMKGDYVYRFRAKIMEPEVQTEIVVDGGLIEGRNGQRPTLQVKDYSDKAQQCVGRLSGISDLVEVAGQEILGRQGYIPLIAPEFAVSKDNAQIYADAANGSYDVLAIAGYQGKKYKNKDNLIFQEDVYWAQTLPAAPVFVWTPLVCRGNITDNKEENQMLHPDKERIPLVLDCDFTVKAEYNGSHIDRPGYGYRDYSSYAAGLEAKFDFPVQKDGRTILPGTWVNIGIFGEKGTFHLPIQSREGKGIVTLRATAVNGTAEGEAAYQWNHAPDFHRVYDEIPVEISGKVHRFAITGIETAGADTPVQKHLPCMADRLPLAVLPLVRGQGCTFTFQTAGGPYNVQDIKIVPQFYIYRQGKRQAVDLYIREQSGNQVVYRPCRTYEEMGTLCIKEQTEPGETIFEGTFSLPSNLAAVEGGFDLDNYLEKKPVFETDECWIKEPILVNFQIETVKNSPYLSYANEKNASLGYCNRWLNEGFRKGEKYDFGDVVVYDLRGDFTRHFLVVGTH